MKSRIGELVRILLVAKSRGAKLVGKSAFEKELNNTLNSPEIVLPHNTPGIYDQNNQIIPNPETYEEWAKKKQGNLLTCW